VWLNKNWCDTSGVNENKWTYLAFRTKENYAKVTLDISEMLKYSRSNNFIDSSLYIADIQLGNEVMSGTGYTWINKYRVRYQ
jgi:hypothetical protein